MIKRTEQIGRTAQEMRIIANAINSAVKETIKNTRVNGVALDIFAKTKPDED